MKIVDYCYIYMCKVDLWLLGRGKRSRNACASRF